MAKIADSRKLIAATGLFGLGVATLVVMYSVSPTDKFGIPVGAVANLQRVFVAALLTVGVLLAFGRRRSTLESVVSVAIALIAAAALTLLLDGILWASRLAFGW